MSNIYAMVDTWNSAGTTFTAIKMNVTDTASAAASILLDLQVASSSLFSVRKDGLVTLIAGTQGTPSLQFTGPDNVGIWSSSDTIVLGDSTHIGAAIGVRAGSSSLVGLTARDVAWIGWSSSGSVAGIPDTRLSRKAAAVISNDKTALGDGLGGFAPQVKAGAFVAGDFPSGSWMVGRDSSGATTKLYYNNGGVLQAVALA